MKKIIEKIKKKIFMFGIKDGSDKDGRYLKIQGRGSSILLKDHRDNYVISSESTGSGFVLYQKSLKDFNDPVKLISEKERAEVLLKFKNLLQKEGYKVSVSD